jgi:anhydro-N-acetylmuramic acid kinase
VAEVFELHHDLGKLYRDQLKRIVRKKKWKIDLIGVHGQTIYHAPPRATAQIGEPSYLAAEFSVPVVSDFRAADLAVGGQGAPIASFFHRVVFQRELPKETFGVHNLGGMSNLSLINASGHFEAAFDTGPGNMLMDLFMQEISHGKKNFDRDGAFAARGIPAQSLVEKILSEVAFFKQLPPKSCGREQFGPTFLKKMRLRMKGLTIEDQMATLAELTARSLGLAYEKLCASSPVAVILCGGGAHNKYLRKRIQYHLPQTQILTTEDFAWPVAAVEGGAFALLAALRIWNQASSLPQTTGARRAVSLGKVTAL